MSNHFEKLKVSPPNPSQVEELGRRLQARLAEGQREARDHGRVRSSTTAGPDGIHSVPGDRNRDTILLEAQSNDDPADPRRRLSGRWLVAAAAVVVLMATLLFETDDDEADRIDSVGSTSTTTAAPDGREVVSSISAEDVEVAHAPGSSLAIDATVRASAASGEFTIEGVVVAVECAALRTHSTPDFSRDVILGGQVTSNEGGRATLDEVHVAVGDLVALIIREGLPAGQRITLYEPALWYQDDAPAGSCTELVDSVPDYLDGGFFRDVIGTIVVS